MKFLKLAALVTIFMTPATAQENRIDLIRPDAPTLAAHGEFPVGVRTMTFTNPDQIDILQVTETAQPRTDRTLTVEVWYPAATGTEAGTTYDVILRDGIQKVPVIGMASRDAAKANGSYPLIIISHGYPGNRYLMSHLGENLASKGYVVASIDHPRSTYSDKQAFGDTLVNRPLDQIFILNAMDAASKGRGPLSGLVDTSSTGLIGYSMGGYGAVIVGGAGVTETAVGYEWGGPQGTLGIHQHGAETQSNVHDDRIKAIVAIGPWGRHFAFWDADGAAGITTPIMYVGGSVDDVSDYTNGISVLYNESVNAERYLLTFKGANHNAAAPMPAPVESWKPVDNLDFIPFEHYADAVWDTRRMNNILAHFTTAFMGNYIQGDAAMSGYLDLVETAEDGVAALNEDGTQKPEHTYWKGFAPRTAKGLSLMQAKP